MEPYSIRPAIITNGVKILMTFIDRIGFPILAFMLMWYLNIRMTDTLNRLNTTLTQQTTILKTIGEKVGVKVVGEP